MSKIELRYTLDLGVGGLDKKYRRQPGVPERQICLEQVTNDSIKTRLHFPSSADHIIGA